MKKININLPIAKTVALYPEVVDIMRELGFVQIVNPVMIKTVGQVMTIKKGAALKNIDIDHIRQTFYEYGYELEE